MPYPLSELDRDHPAQVRVNGRVLIPRLYLLTRFHERAMGLMTRKAPPAGTAFLLYPCGSIHTCLMKFPLDLIFMDRRLRVTRVLRHLAPWRIAFGGPCSAMAIEIAAGTIDLNDIRPGQEARIIPGE